MNYVFKIFIAGLSSLAMSVALAESLPSTHRVAEFSNDRVNVWKTTILPNQNQQLKMHRHDFDRVVVSLSNGTLKITNNKGQVHLLKLEKNHSYYLPKDPINEFHTDNNISHVPIEIMVIELKS